VTIFVNVCSAKYFYGSGSEDAQKELCIFCLHELQLDLIRV